MNNNPTPKTISEKEQEVLKFWLENKIFEKSMETPAGEKAKGDFSFYDGPPFATGLPHYGHILAGTIKDAVPRYQTMNGKSVRRVWGWDCHGLPIENLIEKKLGLKSKKDIEDFGIGKFNKDANDSVLQYEEEWRKVIPRLGRWADMDRPYKTMDATYTESIWWAWKTLYEKGLAYEGNKMMHICPRCETPLAQSEVGLEYHDVTDLSVTAKFELVDEVNTFVLAWTTTPWTLPGNVALALKQEANYVKVSIEGMEGKYIFAEERTGEILKEMKFEVLETFTGSKLVGQSYKPVFPYFIDKEIENKQNIWKIWHADFITLDTGTGIAHEAPAFGAEDMELAKANNFPVIKHVKMDGTFIPDVTDFAGMKVKVKDDTQSADIEIIKWLAHNGKLFEKHKIIHSYPLCWRCKTPLLNHATSSWFVDVPKMKDRLLAENAKIVWVPEHIKEGRFGKWLEGAREWAVSRTRYWGAPLPVWKDENGDIIIIGSLKELAEKNKQKPKNTYYVMRHGESFSNINNVIDVGSDKNNHLTEKGVNQVEGQRDFIKDLNIDLIFSSPVLRAKETAEIVKGEKEIIFEDRLRESSDGVYDGKDVSTLEREVGKDYLNFDYKIEGGESHQEIMNRVMNLIMDCEKNYTNKNILFVTHGGPARMMFAGAEIITEEQVINGDQVKSGNLYLDNAEIRKVNYKIIPRDETGAVNLHRPYIDEIELEVNGKTYKRIGDVFDCWFESGSMPFAQLHYPFENKDVFDKNYPADFIAEGLDQTRGWFYSLINLGVGLFDKAPYKHVAVNGLILADTGEKLSKSEKNYTDPMILVEKYGADSMRYALLSSSVVKGEDLLFSDENVSDVYKKLVSRLLNVVSLYEMNKPEKVEAKNSSDNVLDIWMMSRVHELVRDSTSGYESYKLDEATRGIGDLIDDISVWYTRRSRDRLKGDQGLEDQIRSYETLTYVLQTLAKVMAPVMPFTAEMVYKSLNGEKESVHLESWPKEGVINEEVIKEMKKVREVVTVALSLRTASKIAVRQPLQKITLKEEIKSEYYQIILDELNVKEITFNNSNEDVCILDTEITEELKIEGEVRNLMRAVQDTRKEKGLTPKDSIILLTNYSVPEKFREVLMNTCKISEIKDGSGKYKAETSGGEVLFDIN
ncbi:MAG: class I tRNA ligase family protein [Candidatus Nomurabacteria bacterium]|nr:class I tRNA ligase family protein [Candidatus Nomurabacteria bacterium]